MDLERLKIVIIFFGFFYILTTNCQQQQQQQKCPTGKLSAKLDCNRTQYCPPGSICYRRNDSKGISKTFCCGELDKFCPTKMYAFNSYYRASFIWGVGNKTNNKEFYTIKLGNETVACPMPFSFTYRTKIKLLPVDFSETNAQSSTPEACTTNWDCKTEDEEFCGATSHPSSEDFSDNSGKNGVPIRFCYKFHNFGAKIKPLIKRDRQGLEGCATNLECFKSHGYKTFCFINNKSSYFYMVGKEGKVTETLGVCAIAHVCDSKKYESTVATQRKSGDFCMTTKDCEGISDNSTLKPECVDGPSNIGKLCCLRHYRVCDVGFPQNPVKSCRNSKDCHTNGPVDSIWCDAKFKHCCEDDGTKAYLCPDGFTTLLNQAKCEGYNKTDIDSGKCPKEQATCRYGHCCPSLIKEEENKEKGNITVVGDLKYITDAYCDPSSDVPSKYLYSFCDPETKRIKVISKTELIYGERTACSTNRDCHQPSEVCLRETKGASVCVRNPFAIKRGEDHLRIWRGILNDALVVTPITLVGLILFGMLYYWNIADRWCCGERRRIKKLNTAIEMYETMLTAIEKMKREYELKRQLQLMMFKGTTLDHVVKEAEDFKTYCEGIVNTLDDDLEWMENWISYFEQNNATAADKRGIDDERKKRLSAAKKEYDDIIRKIKKGIEPLLLNMPDRMKRAIDNAQKPGVQKKSLNDHQKFMIDTENWVQEAKDELNSAQHVILYLARGDEEKKPFEEEHCKWLEEQDQWLQKQQNAPCILGPTEFARTKKELLQMMTEKMKSYEEWSKERVESLEVKYSDLCRMFKEFHLKFLKTD